METHSNLSDLDFENQLTDCSLSPTLFNHEAHLRLAWLSIHKYGVEEATRRIQEQLKNYVAFLGAEEKYNTTLTIAAIRAVNHFMLKSEADDFKSFVKAFPQLKSDFKGLMNQHYSFDIFDSKRVKDVFVEPDLLPFD